MVCLCSDKNNLFSSAEQNSYFSVLGIIFFFNLSYWLGKALLLTRGRRYRKLFCILMIFIFRKKSLTKKKVCNNFRIFFLCSCTSSALVCGHKMEQQDDSHMHKIIIIPSSFSFIHHALCIHCSATRLPFFSFSYICCACINIFYHLYFCCPLSLRFADAQQNWKNKEKTEKWIAYLLPLTKNFLLQIGADGVHRRVQNVKWKIAK